MRMIFKALRALKPNISQTASDSETTFESHIKIITLEEVVP